MDNQPKSKPLTLGIGTARIMILTAINKAQQECGIPNFILEGIIAEIYSQITLQSKNELINDFNSYTKKDEGE